MISNVLNVKNIGYIYQTKIKKNIKQRHNSIINNIPFKN